MLIADVPNVPAQNTPMVLAQGNTATSARQPDYILKECQESASASDIDPRSAVHVVDPAYMLKNYFDWNDKTRTQKIDLAAIKTTLLQGTTHGKIIAEVDNEGLTSYRYDPIPEYIGNDKALFMAEFEGKVYRIVINFVVAVRINENPLMDDELPVCPPPQLIKVTNPSSGNSGFGSGYNVVSVSVSYSPTRRSSGTPQKRGAP